MMPQDPTPQQSGEQLSKPVFYERPELLTPERHGGKSLGAASHHRFARATNTVPLTGAEFALAQRHYPIVFSEEGAPFPMAILGLRDAENLFVGAEGAWEGGAYVPAYVRRYPFVFMADADKQQLALCIDAACEFLVDGDANPLFRDGVPTDATKNALAFCTSFQAEYEKTQAFAAALSEQQLLVSRTASVELRGSRKLVFGPFRLIDDSKLAELPEALIAEWFRRGWLAWIHAHLLSFANWPNLANRVTAPS
jgi:hypothetical protein